MMAANPDRNGEFLIEVFGGGDRQEFAGSNFTIQVYQQRDGRRRPSIRIDCFRKPDGTLVTQVEDWS